MEFNILTALVGNITLDKENNKIKVELQLNGDNSVHTTFDAINCNNGPVNLTLAGFAVSISYTKAEQCDCMTNRKITHMSRPRFNGVTDLRRMFPNIEQCKCITPGTLMISVTQNIVSQSNVTLLFDIKKDSISIHWRKMIYPMDNLESALNEGKKTSCVVMGTTAESITEFTSNEVSFAVLTDNLDTPINMMIYPEYSTYFNYLSKTDPEYFGKLLSRSEINDDLAFIPWVGEYVRTAEITSTETSTLNVECNDKGDDKDDTTESE